MTHVILPSEPAAGVNTLRAHSIAGADVLRI
jgi:hypothetical protein